MFRASRAWEWLTRPLRLIRWRVSGWSSRADQEFHDRLFEGATYDPFSDAYPGYLTIRRFADYAARHFADVRSVVDLGCGPGEITCELARRFPDVTFYGIDHSSIALDRARTLANRLQLANVSFQEGDFDIHGSLGAIDMVVMFDAFHHVLDPAAFLRKIKERGSRLFIVEPAGTWTGSWDRRGDLDWLPLTLLQIRDRLEEQFGLEPVRHLQPHVPQTPVPDASAPTEHRYPRADFERLFSGFGLTLRGTIAGLEQYGPRPYDRGPMREAIGRLVYEFVVQLDDMLFEQGLDLAAKHWTIFAQPGHTGSPRDIWSRQPALHFQPAIGLLPAYGVEYGQCLAPGTVDRGERFTASMHLTNTGWRAWDSDDAQPTSASYHWLDTSGCAIVHDGVRTPFADVVRSGDTVSVQMNVIAPEAAGTYRLVVDIVREGVTWFSEQGCRAHSVAIEVRPTPTD